MSGFKRVKSAKMSLSKRKLIYGYGVNDSHYNVSLKVDGVRLVCPFYKVWTSMLARVFGSKIKPNKNSETYTDTSVCNEWLSFNAFRLWMESKDWQGKELDKDILKTGNRVYSPDFCCFVDKEVNMILVSANKIRGKFKRGVSFHKATGKFRAKMSLNGKDVELGLFGSEVEAYNCYVDKKFEAIKSIAEKQPLNDVKMALIRHAYELYITKQEVNKV